MNAFLWLLVIILALGVVTVVASVIPRRRTFRRTEVVEASPVSEPAPDPRPGERIVRREEVDRGL